MVINNYLTAYQIILLNHFIAEHSLKKKTFFAITRTVTTIVSHGYPTLRGSLIYSYLYVLIWARVAAGPHGPRGHLGPRGHYPGSSGWSGWSGCKSAPHHVIICQATTLRLFTSTIVVRTSMKSGMFCCLCGIKKMRYNSYLWYVFILIQIEYQSVFF